MKSSSESRDLGYYFDIFWKILYKIFINFVYITTFMQIFIGKVELAQIFEGPSSRLRLFNVKKGSNVNHMENIA